MIATPHQSKTNNFEKYCSEARRIIQTNDIRFSLLFDQCQQQSNRQLQQELQFAYKDLFVVYCMCKTRKRYKIGNKKTLETIHTQTEVQNAHAHHLAKLYIKCKKLIK